MKPRTSIAILLGVLGSLLVVGCDICDPCCDDCAPPPPGGVTSITGDGRVTILWNEVHVSDLVGYRVYWSDTEFGAYSRIGSTGNTFFVDTDVVNGVTYFYAVAAYDDDGNESDLSYETVFDTPRPSGRNLTVFDEDDHAGIDFSEYYSGMIVPWDDPYADLFLLWLDGHYCMASTDVEVGQEIYGNDIQYAGYVSSLDEIGWAPDGGWSVEVADTVTLYEGHASYVWTWDNHFAKFKVTHIGFDYVVMDWAYQIDEGNPELSIVVGTGGSGRSVEKTAVRTLPANSRTGKRPDRESASLVPAAQLERR